MSTSAAREAYKLRKQLVEPVFGIIKEQHGARRFLLRSLVNVAAEWTMLATAFTPRHHLIRLALHWYLLSNETHSLEGGIVLAQAALERLSQEMVGKKGFG